MTGKFQDISRTWVPHFNEALINSSRDTYIESCHNGELHNLAQDRCVENCKEDEYINMEANSCVSNCPFGQVPHQNKTCVGCAANQIINTIKAVCEFCEDGRRPNERQTKCIGKL